MLVLSKTQKKHLGDFPPMPPPPSVTHVEIHTHCSKFVLTEARLVNTTSQLQSFIHTTINQQRLNLSQGTQVLID